MSGTSFQEKLDAAIKASKGELVASLPTVQYELTPATGGKTTVDKFDIRQYKFPRREDYTRFYNSQNALVLDIIEAPQPESVAEEKDGSVIISLEYS